MKKYQATLSILILFVIVMPIFVACSNSPSYKISLATCSNGSVTASKKKAKVGDVVTIETHAELGYKIKALSLKQNGISIGGNSFKMPSEDVIITADFEPIRENERLVTVNETKNGKVEIEKEYFAENEMVYITITPDDGFRLKEGSLKYNSNEVTTDFAFSMPFENIVITAEFEKLPSGYSAIVTERVLYGRIIANKSSARIGETVSIKFLADSGYQIMLDSLKCNDETFNGNTVTATGVKTLIKAEFVKTEYMRVNEAGYKDKNGEYMFFGYYPTTIKHVDVTVGKADDKGIYTGSDGSAYVKYTATPFDSNINFTNGRLVKSGTDYYFKLESVKWRILSENSETALLLSENILDVDYFLHPSNMSGESNIKKDVPKGTNANNWKYSDVKTYLQNTVYNTLFTKSHNYFISDSVIEGEKVKISLLSEGDIANGNYKFNTNIFSNDTKRIKYASDYVRARGAFVDSKTNNYGEWMLRSPLSSSKANIQCSTSLGSVFTGARADARGRGIVPVITIKFN